MKKHNDRGFTLIELLVAVTVLGIIIIPLLHSFLSAYRVNAKSRQYMRATTLAQNEMEIFEKEKLADLVAMEKTTGSADLVYNTVTSDGTAVTAANLQALLEAEGTAWDGGFTFSRQGIVNDESGRSLFDVKITLNPERAGSGSRYYTQNTEELLQMSTISNLDSGSYVQRIRSASNEVDYDSVVYGIFNTRKAAGGVGTSWTKDDFEAKLERRITINVSQDLEDSLGKITKVKITYTYTCNEYGVMPDEYKTYTEEKIMFDNAQTLDEDGKRVELKSLYLFYAPRYDTAHEDVIAVENEAKLPIEVYILRQDIWKKTADEVRPVPAGYQAKLEIKDGLTTDGAGRIRTYARYRTNLNIDATVTPPIEGVGKELALSLSDYDNPSRVFSASEIKEATGLRSLGEAEAKDRIYSMKVEIYKAGADQLTEEPVVTMTGSKLE